MEFFHYSLGPVYLFLCPFLKISKQQLQIVTFSQGQMSRYSGTSTITKGPVANVFQWPFLRSLFLERLIFVGGYLRTREICVSKLIGLALQLEGNYRFALFYFAFEGNFQVQALPPPPPRRGANIWRADLTDSFLHCEFGGLIFGGAYFRNFTVCNNEDVYSHDEG